jgi:hypothetical protein
MSSYGGAGLLELVARGKKDTFFTGSPKISFFHSVYVRARPWLRETRYLLPRNEADFGSYVDFVLDPVGDIIQNIHCLIHLPSWLPQEIVEKNGTSLVRDASGTAFGYTNNIAYHFIQKIQMFQNQVLIYEDFGEAMLLRLTSKSRKGVLSVYKALAGGNDGSALQIQRSATHNELEIRLQLPFDNRPGDFGIPITAVSPFTLRLRLYLAPLQNLIETSKSLSTIRPDPFGKVFTIQETKTSGNRTFKTKERSELGKPSIQLRVQYVYVDGKSQKLLQEGSWRIPYIRCLSNEFTLEDVLWKINQSASIRKQIELYGNVQRIRAVFQSEANRLAGRLSDYSPITGSDWFTSLTLLIHGTDRVGNFGPEVFSRIIPYSHDVGLSYPNVYCLDTGAEDLNFPAGTLNMSQAEKPEIQVMLSQQNADMRTESKKSFLIIYADVWDVLLLDKQWIKLPFIG